MDFKDFFQMHFGQKQNFTSTLKHSLVIKGTLEKEVRLVDEDIVRKGDFMGQSANVAPKLKFYLKKVLRFDKCIFITCVQVYYLTFLPQYSKGMWVFTVSGHLSLSPFQ
ncbi:hypothetical protein KIL84_018775 [Mauremys mutica]|uniref:Uncharacterized protein n=1 Tax=Mauremys mutica TaxID=74926 RepID=A0A9D3XTS1_9SAUR|nr:hypothetical protein KIL84_018775 [Mauremys mutica]